MKSEVIDSYLIEIEGLIRSGRSKTALKFARGLASKRLNKTESQLIRLANLLRRAGGFSDAIRLLHKKVRGKFAQKPGAAHAEYACALVQLGLIEEAYKILESVDSKLYPMAHLYRALGNFSEWNYKDASVILKKFVQAENVDPYQRVVGRVNLLVAQAYTEPSENLIIQLDQLLAETREKKLVLLEGVVSQVRGRLLTTLGKFAEAAKVYKKGLEKMKLVETFDRFYLEKWQLINFVKQGGLTKSSEGELRKLQARAFAAGDFETARDCGYYYNLLRNDTEGLNFCFYGTPYGAYRERFSKIQDQAWLKIDESGAAGIRLSPPSSPVFDVDNFLHPGRLLHRLFFALLSDFYRPVTVPRIFQIAFPNQTWNPSTSPIQVRQALFRLREVLRESNSELEIKFRRKGYQLSARVPRYIVMKLEVESYESGLLQQLPKEFTFQDFQRLTGYSLRTSRRLMSSLVNQRLVEVGGKTRQATYKQLIR